LESRVYWPRTGLARLRSSRFVAILAVLALTLAACSGGDDGSSTAPGDSEAPGASQAPGESGGATGGFEAPTENVELTLWNPFTGPDGDFFTQIVEDFNAATPTCQVTVETKVGGEYAAQLEAAASANELPHVIAAGYDALSGHVENGIVVPIDDFAEQGGYGPDLFPEAIWNAGEWKGQRVGIPIDTHTMNLYYNKALFEEAGLDPESAPADEASFEEAITAIGENTDASGYQVVGSGPGGNFLAGIQFAALFYQGGGEWTNEDFTEVTFNSEAGVQAAEYLAHLASDLDAPVVESDAEINAFQQGQNGMVMSGIWETTRYSEALGEDLGNHSPGCFPDAEFPEAVLALYHHLWMSASRDDVDYWEHYASQSAIEVIIFDVVSTSVYPGIVGNPTLDAGPVSQQWWREHARQGAAEPGMRSDEEKHLELAQLMLNRGEIPAMMERRVANRADETMRLFAATLLYHDRESVEFSTDRYRRQPRQSKTAP